MTNSECGSTQIIMGLANRMSYTHCESSTSAASVSLTRCPSTWMPTVINSDIARTFGTKLVQRTTRVTTSFSPVNFLLGCPISGSLTSLRLSPSPKTGERASLLARRSMLVDTRRAVYFSREHPIYKDKIADGDGYASPTKSSRRKEHKNQKAPFLW